MSIFIGQHIYSADAKINFRVCFVSSELQKAAVADMNKVEEGYQIKKPMVKTFAEIYELIRKLKCPPTSLYQLPNDINKSDAQLIAEGRDTWIRKRDAKFENLKELTKPEIIRDYLFLGGIKSVIEDLLGSGSWTCAGAFYKELNRFIAYGCGKNSLLPFSLKNVGSNYLQVSDEDVTNPKRGRGGKNNENSRSKSKGITQETKKQIASVCIYAKKKKLKKIRITTLFNLFKDTYQVIESMGPDGAPRRVAKEERYGITYQQFRYHFKLIVDDEKFLRLIHGDIRYEKDFEPVTGVARDGVIGPSHRYEIDSTILDMYIRYPYDPSGRSSMGRPVVYIVIDVYSTAIVGFYIGFTGPNWEGASEALINAFSNKVELCKRYGIEITEEDWCCSHICTQIAMDNGVDYPEQSRLQLLQSMIGINEIISLALFRGDAKGVCERKFKILQEDVIENEPGAVYKNPRREDAHPSNETLWDLDGVTKIIIEEILFHNKSSDRLKNHNFDLASNNVGITPLAIYKYGIEREMNYGRKTDTEDILRARWALLREYTATVDGESGSIKLDGLHYHCEYANEQRWYHRAKFKGNFKIFVRKTKASTNTIWYKSEEGEIIEIHLKDDYISERYANQHWDAVSIRVDEYKDESHALEVERERLRIEREGKIDEHRKEQYDAVAGAPENTRKSMVSSTIKTFKDIQKEMENLELAERYANAISPGVNNKKTTNPNDEYHNF